MKEPEMTQYHFIKFLAVFIVYILRKKDIKLALYLCKCLSFDLYCGEILDLSSDTLFGF